MIGYIYLTTNLINNKIYIGQHMSSIFEPEKYIGSGCKFKIALSHYGRENFKCIMLEACDTTEQLNQREKYYIKQYNSQDKSIGYNIADGGEEPWNRGKVLSEYYREINRKTQRKLANNLICFNLATGEKVGIFESAYDAAEFVNVNGKIGGSRILTVCHLKKGHAYGYIWRFLKDYLECNQLSIEELQKEHKQPRAKTIQQFDLENNLLAEFESAASYSKTQSDEYNVQRRVARRINGCCLGDTKTYLGFIWKYKN